MNVPEFQAIWSKADLTERASAQSHFLDLCELVGHQKPQALDPTGEFFTFERNLGKTGGGSGFADVWFKDHFAWEYKGPGKDLQKALSQLKLYAQALNNPPLLIVSDYDRIEIHTNWTNSEVKTYVITLETLGEQLHLLKAAFFNPDELKPGVTRAQVTREAAEKIGKIALGLHQRDEQPAKVAHFLVQILFCLFAEDVELLPRGVFGKTLDGATKHPERFVGRIQTLFEAMRDGGDFGADEIQHFNGGLFAKIEPIPLTVDELRALWDASKLDWSNVEPAIFGTLFERSLDPQSRAQLGAHYTGRPDIERVVEPVVMTPLRRRWDEVRAQADTVRIAWTGATTPQVRANRRNDFAAILNGFKDELSRVTVLDPACGSGNFLYVALARLLDLEKEVLVYGAMNGLPLGFPLVSPSQFSGLEINQYAQELAQVVIWIGYLQWKRDNGFPGNDTPILKPLSTIKLQDALLDLTDPDHPKEAEWPKADYIIGNPPFLGGKRIRADIGDEYTDTLHRVFSGKLPPFADLCCYFFEKARAQVQANSSQRVGLLATNSIRGGANRVVLERIEESGNIFLAWSDEPWVLDGAAVRISIVGFDNGTEVTHVLDGKSVDRITSALTSGTDLSSALRLRENARIGFIGIQPTGPFDIDEELALRLRALPVNPNGRSNADVVFPYYSGSDIVGRWPHRWIIDFGFRTLEEAALYEAPFEYINHVVKPYRLSSKNNDLHKQWWIHWRPRGDMRNAIEQANPARICVTPHVSKHRIFSWLPRGVVPNNLLIVYVREDDYFFGVLHSRVHELWSLRMGTWLGVGNDPRYTPTTCFETFPLPWPPGTEPVDDPRVQAIAAAAKELNTMREGWLNPPDAGEAELKKRTLTNLYNQRPTWLAMLHANLNRAVWAAYGWDDPDPAAVEDDVILSRLLALNLERSR